MHARTIHHAGRMTAQRACRCVRDISTGQRIPSGALCESDSIHLGLRRGALLQPLGGRHLGRGLGQPRIPHPAPGLPDGPGWDSDLRPRHHQVDGPVPLAFTVAAFAGNTGRGRRIVPSIRISRLTVVHCSRSPERLTPVANDPLSCPCRIYRCISYS